MAIHYPVVTELDGLRTNPSTLGKAAKEALEYLEQLLPPNTPHANRPHNIRIQTSHNNFLHDISVRSEQFMWGETDRNLDDLVLSVCLWWTMQPAPEVTLGIEKVCLVTNDRNLSVKARARDLRVTDTHSLARIMI
jgi:predicted ribonuclease YlaK